MPKTIQREQLKRAYETNTPFEVVETLPREEFERFHLPGAKNAPPGEQFERVISSVAPEKTDPIVVYCKDTACNASTQAAEQMERMGYREVYDYEAGKEDWKSAGLPVESAS